MSNTATTTKVELDPKTHIWCYSEHGYDPHEVILHCSPEEKDKFTMCEQFAVIEDMDGARWIVSRADCGAGCRCAARATSMRDES